MMQNPFAIWAQLAQALADQLQDELGTDANDVSPSVRLLIQSILDLQVRCEEMARRLDRLRETNPLAARMFDRAAAKV